MGIVLFYNLSPDRQERLTALCDKLFLTARAVKKSEYGYPLGHLLGLSQDTAVRAGTDFSEEMLYLSGFPDGMLHLFLDLLRREDLIIPLKAVQTDTNVGFTSRELYRELSAERTAIQQGFRRH